MIARATDPERHNRAVRRGLRRETEFRRYEPTEHPYATRIKLLEAQNEETLRLLQAVMARLDARPARRGM